jgi:proline iminopeptidase
MPVEKWPEPVTRSFSRLNRQIYVLMQGPSEMGAHGKLDPWDRSADLPKISVPTLVIVGRRDFITNVAMAEEMVNHVPNARMEIFEESGHYGFVEEPDKFYRVVKAFVEE